MLWGQPGGAFTAVPGLHVVDPIAMVVDGSGDLFVAGYHGDRIVELPRIDATTFGAQIDLFAGQHASPEGIAVDKAGDLFVARH